MNIVLMKFKMKVMKYVILVKMMKKTRKKKRTKMMKSLMKTTRCWAIRLSDLIRLHHLRRSLEDGLRRVVVVGGLLERERGRVGPDPGRVAGEGPVIRALRQTQGSFGGPQRGGGGSRVRAAWTGKHLFVAGVGGGQRRARRANIGSGRRGDGAAEGGSRANGGGLGLANLLGGGAGRQQVIGGLGGQHG